MSLISPVSVSDTGLQNPFKFLNSYGRDERKYFNGRDEEIDLLYDMVRRRNIQLVFGESGVGKTSLVQCGLANKFQSADWFDVLILRNNDINNSLKTILIDKLTAPEDNPANLTMLELIEALYIENFKPVYLIFDQLEELFINGTENERDIFYKTIKDILKVKNYCCKIIFIIREEFHSKLTSFESNVAPIFTSGFKIKRMKSINAEDVVRRALQNNISTIKVDPGYDEISKLIVECCTKDKDGEVDPLQLQVFLFFLWHKGFKKDQVNEPVSFTEDLVRELGQIKDRLKQYVKESVADVGGENEGGVWRFLNLFVSKEETKITVNIETVRDIPQNDLTIWVDKLVEKEILRKINKQHFELLHDTLAPIVKSFQSKSTRPRNPNPITGNPYKGLLSYTQEDTKLFFGRQKVKEELLKKINNERLIAVVGSSGSGKSSLIKAGILPVLEKEGYKVFFDRPGNHPAIILDKIESFLEKNSDKRIIIYIDQFEELTTQCDDEKERDEFIKYIKDLVNTNRPLPEHVELKVILSIRSDYEYEFISKFGQWKEIKFNVPFFTPEEIVEVITEPAYQAGLTFSPDSLVDKMVNEVLSYTGTLPLLSYTLKEMYEDHKEKRNDNVITEEDYKNCGGVIEGLKTRADAIYNQYGPDDPHIKTIRNLTLRMCSLGINERAAKRVLPNEIDYGDPEENIRVQEILQKFVNKGLIICGRSPDGTVAYYEPAHDSLVRNWDLIGKFIAQFAKTVYLRKNLGEAINIYKNGGSLWHENDNLNFLLSTLKSDDNWLNKEEKEFVLASIKKREELKDIERKAEEEKDLLNQRLFEEQQKATLLLQQKLEEEQKSAVLLKEKLEEQEKAAKLDQEKLEEQQKAEQLLKEKLDEEQKGALLSKQKLEEEQKSARLNEEKLEEQRRRTVLLSESRRGLVAGFIAFAALALFYFTRLNAKDKFLKQQNHSLEIAKGEADNGRKRAEFFFDSARKLLDTNRVLLAKNVFLIKKYKAEKETAENLGKRYLQARDSLAQSLVASKRQVDTMKFVVNQFQRTLARADLQNEAFYTKLNIDAFAKQQYLDKLISMRFGNIDSSQYHKYKNTLTSITSEKKESVEYNRFKNALNKISDAFGQKDFNPNTALVLAKQAHDLYHSEIIDSLALGIANNNFFYKHKVDLTGRVGKRLYAIVFSKDKSRFAYATYDDLSNLSEIRTGMFTGDSLVLDNQPRAVILNDSKAGSFNRQLRFISLGYTNENSLVALRSDNKQLRWTGSSREPMIKPILKSKPDSSYFYISTMSPDCKYLLRDSSDVYIKVINLERGSGEAWNSRFDTIGRYITSFRFSSDSKNAIVNTSGNQCWILNLESKSARHLADSIVYAANFTNDGQYIVYESKDSLRLADLYGNVIGTSISKSANNLNRFRTNKILLSPDWKSLVLEGRSGGATYMENLDEKKQKEPLFSLTSSKTIRPNIVKIGSDDVLEILGDNRLLSYNRPVENFGSAYTNVVSADSVYQLLLFKRFNHFNNFDKAYSQIDPYLTTRDSISIELTPPNNQERYEKALDLYEQSFDYSLSAEAKKQYLVKAKDILENLLAPNEDNFDYLFNLQSVNRRIFAVDSNYLSYISEINKLIAIEERLLKKHNTNASSEKYQNYKKELADNYGSLSFYLAFIRPVDSATMIKAANTALLLNGGSDYVYTNIALAYLLSKDFDKAKNVYKRYKGKKCYTCSTGQFTKSFLLDLDELERRKVISDKVDLELYDFVQKLKCWLRDDSTCPTLD